jgi:hypothetical protein
MLLSERKRPATQVFEVAHFKQKELKSPDFGCDGDKFPSSNCPNSGEFSYANFEDTSRTAIKVAHTGVCRLSPV